MIKQSKIHVANVRATETPDKSSRRKETILKCDRSRRKRGLSVEKSIAAFHSEIQSDPDYVCMCCHRMMYRNSVVRCRKYKCAKVSPQVVFSADFSYMSCDGKT